MDLRLYIEKMYILKLIYMYIYENVDVFHHVSCLNHLFFMSSMYSCHVFSTDYFIIDQKIKDLNPPN